MYRFFVWIFLLIPFISQSTDPFQQKTLVIIVDAKGQVSIDRIKIETDDLPRELQQRLWRSFVGNGKMPQVIKVQFENELPPESTKAILEAVKQGQQRTLNILSLHKYKNKFENITTRKQDKIKKQFPVLFQEDLLSTG
ncbi:MAG TPA: hypothetical protein VF487_21265 [Chitinophagaceae bacterium]